MSPVKHSYSNERVHRTLTSSSPIRGSLSNARAERQLTFSLSPETLVSKWEYWRDTIHVLLFSNTPLASEETINLPLFSITLLQIGMRSTLVWNAHLQLCEQRCNSHTFSSSRTLPFFRLWELASHFSITYLSLPLRCVHGCGDHSFHLQQGSKSLEVL